jgi:carbonic anhydrase
MQNKYKAMVLSCIDPRFQPIVYDFLKKRKLKGKYSSFTIAGSSLSITSGKFRKWQNTFWENLQTSINIHKIKKLIVINHRDCGAAKILNGKNPFNKLNETKLHKISFKRIRKLFKKKHPKLRIETIVLNLNKKVEKF